MTTETQEYCFSPKRTAMNKARYEKRKKQAQEYLGGVCVECGTDEHLEFDHIVPSDKSYVISTNMGRAWTNIVKELDKCQLLCHSCHATKTWKNLVGKNPEGPMNARSYSAINTYQRCPTLFKYRYIYNLQPIKRSVALFDGTNAHEFLKVFFLALQQGENTDGAWQAVMNHVATIYEKNKGVLFDDEQVDLHERIDETLEWIEAYCDQFGDEWEILHVEEEFYIMLEGGEIISFTPDLIIRDRNGYIWIVDHKTTSALPSAGIPFGDMQALLYYVGIKEIYPEVAGFIFNRIRKKVPTQPRLTKTGKKRVANLKNIDTTYEVLRDFLQREAPDLMSDPDHQIRLAQLRDAPKRWFWTENVYVNETTEEDILEAVVWVLKQIKDSEEARTFPRHLMEDRGYRSCNRCAFQPICRAEMVGWSADTLIDSLYEPREAKNPYEGEEDDTTEQA